MFKVVEVKRKDRCNYFDDITEYWIAKKTDTDYHEYLHSFSFKEKWRADDVCDYLNKEIQHLVSKELKRMFKTGDVRLPYELDGCNQKAIEYICDSDYDTCSTHKSGLGGGKREIRIIQHKKKFDLMECWNNKESDRIKKRLENYKVRCDYENGFLVIEDKGVLIFMDSIRSTLAIPEHISCLPFYIKSNGVSKETVVINMSRLKELWRKKND